MRDSSVGREVNAVHSEYEIALLNQEYKNAAILFDYMEDTSNPITRFMIGNLDTLKGKNDEKTLANYARQFFSENYSPSLMSMCLYGPGINKYF